MNRVKLTIFVLVPILTECPGMKCDCDRYNDFALPEGEFGEGLQCSGWTVGD